MSQVPAQASSHALVVADVAQLKILVEGIRAEGGALFGSKIGQLKKKGFLYSGKSLKEFLSRCSGVIEKRSRGSDGQFELYLTQQFDKDEVQRQCDDKERGIKTSSKKKSRKEKKAEKNKNGGRKRNTTRPKKKNTAAPMLNAAALNSHQKLDTVLSCKRSSDILWFVFDFFILFFPVSKIKKIPKTNIEK